MTYYGKPGLDGGWDKKWLGIKPTKKDHDAVHTWSIMGLTVVEIARKLGMRFGLGRPMSKMTMYYHFRKDLLVKPKGRRAHDKTVKLRITKNLSTEMRAMINEIREKKSDQQIPGNQKKDTGVSEG